MKQFMTETQVMLHPPTLKSWDIKEKRSTLYFGLTKTGLSFLLLLCLLISQWVLKALNPVPENYTNKIVERTRGVLKYKLDKIQSTLV